MRGVLALATIAIGGCGFTLSFDGAPADASDASSDAPEDAGCSTFSIFIDTCEQPRGDSLELVGNHTFDTDSGLLTDAIGTVLPVKTAVVNLAGNGIDVQAIFIDELLLDGVLTGRGSRPFAIIATGSIDLVGTSVIEVGVGGAGAQDICANPAQPGEQDNGGGGGGGGGGLGAPGGAGGNADSDNGGSDGGPGGLESTPPSAIIGGCRGGNGGDGDDEGGKGGAGGGAVFVVSRVEISIGATAGINAGGAGGGGGVKTNAGGDAGAGGGGSGGTILLEAPRVRNDGTLSANGGGGGEGSDNGGETGDAGDDARLGTAQALGGDGKSSGGAGGAAGGNSAMPSGGPQPERRPGGGGGGGGSVGFIRVVAATMDLGSKVSPLPFQ